MWKWFRWVLVIIGAAFLVLLLFATQPWVYLPHRHVEISLPFAPEEDSNTYLIPLGEKIEHNASNGTPDGHPGIDFGWDKETNVLAIADGRIIRITKNQYGIYVIQQQIGPFYRTMYQELNSIDSNLHFLSKVKKGQILGKTGRPNLTGARPKEGDPSRQVHLDFASSSMFIDRLCPLNYFDAESKARIQKIWANVPATDQFKKQYPEICNGIFKGKED